MPQSEKRDVTALPIADQQRVDFVYAHYGEPMADTVEAILRGDPTDSTQYAKFVRRSISREIAWWETT